VHFEAPLNYDYVRTAPRRKFSGMVGAGLPEPIGCPFVSHLPCDVKHPVEVNNETVSIGGLERVVELHVLRFCLHGAA
jgi:hypothetical protein